MQLRILVLTSTAFGVVGFCAAALLALFTAEPAPPLHAVDASATQPLVTRPTSDFAQ